MEKYFEMQYYKYDAKNIVLHKMQHFVVVEQYLKETKGRPLDQSFPDISRTIPNFLTLVERNVFKITRGFYYNLKHFCFNDTLQNIPH